MDSRIIKDLLDKYFEGATTLKEESYLRQYFSSGKIDPEFCKYSQLFNFFSKEIDEINIPASSKKPKIKLFNKKLIYGSFSMTAAAAIAIFTFLVWPSPQNGVILKIGGERINNEQIVRLKAEGHLLKINEMMGLVGQNSISLDKLKEVKKSLLPINKLGNKDE